jgi:hypothetical protein
MIISASGTVLSYDTAVDRIRAIIDSDPRIKAEIQAKMGRLDPSNSSALKKLSTNPNLTKQERDHEIELKKRELATFDQYIHDNIFGQAVDAVLV